MLISETNTTESQKRQDRYWMTHALSLASSSFEQAEVPVGAVIVRDNKVLGEGNNNPISHCDSTAHAEINALRQACASDHNYRLPGATVYVTLEPCTMCLGALMHARIERLVFAAYEPKAGVVVSNPIFLDADFFNHTMQWCGGTGEVESKALLQSFFAERRRQKKEARTVP